jgi:hypothetical protein
LYWNLVAEIATILVSGAIGAIAGMFIDAFFKGLLWSKISYMAKAFRLRSKRDIRIEMRRSLELLLGIIPPSDVDKEIQRIRKDLLHESQKTFKDADFSGTSAVRAVSPSDEEVEIEFQFCEMDGGANQTRRLRIMLVCSTSTPFKELLASYSSMLLNIGKMADTVQALGLQQTTSDRGRLSLTVLLKREPSVLTQTSKIGISGFTSDKGTYKISATKGGIVFDGVFTKETSQSLKDFIVWFS